MSDQFLMDILRKKRIVIKKWEFYVVDLDGYETVVKRKFKTNKYKVVARFDKDGNLM